MVKTTEKKLVEFASTVKAKGLKLLLDFHYSDTWADPAHQVKPAAWAGYDFNRLQKALYEHTLVVCSNLKSAGASPEMVQIGNEINPGMLLPDGSTANWDNLSALLKQGYHAVKTCSAVHAGNAPYRQRWRQSGGSHLV